MLKNILKHFLKKTRNVSIVIDCSDSLLVVHLHVNDQRIAWINCVMETDKTILIGDIQHRKEHSDYNKGYGSMMMDKLLQYARENGFCHIHGNLSEVDWDHKDRLHHFYEKFGFSITEYQEQQGCYYGKINLQL